MAQMAKQSLSDFRQQIVGRSFPQVRCLADAFDQMSFVQADPIRAPARAQDLILRQRVADYSAGQLEREYAELGLEEGFLFAYGFMIPEIWSNLRRKPKKRLDKLERRILETITHSGEIHPRGLDKQLGGQPTKNPWGGTSQETKRVLEKLHDLGQLRVRRRENGIRVYSLPDEPEPSFSKPRRRFQSIATSTLHVFGPTTRRFLLSELRHQNHWVPNRSDRVKAIDELISSEQVIETEVDGTVYLSTPYDSTIDESLERIRILAPFDPLVRDRGRFKHLWAWDYRFEAYVPKAKRELGYYAMPLLWRNMVIGWANANVTEDQLHVELAFVEKRPRAKGFRQRCEEEVNAMARFLGLDENAWRMTV